MQAMVTQLNITDIYAIMSLFQDYINESKLS